MKVALLLRGISYLKEYCTSSCMVTNIDYTENISSLKENLINCYDDIDIYISTNNHHLINDLKREFNPTKIHIYDVDDKHDVVNKLNNETKNLLDGINLIDSSLYDTIIISRIDISYYGLITNLNIDYNKVNFLWREASGWDEWNNTYKSANVLWCMPSKFLINFCNALKNFDKVGECNAPTHFVCSELKNTIGFDNINFMVNGFYYSWCCSGTTNPVYNIISHNN
jgi:hypothetical protein